MVKRNRSYITILEFAEDMDDAIRVLGASFALNYDLVRRFKDRILILCIVAIPLGFYKECSSEAVVTHRQYLQIEVNRVNIL